MTLSQYLSKPLQEHWVAPKHVLRYWKGTLDYELCYRKCSEDLKLIGYSDDDCGRLQPMIDEVLVGIFSV